MDCSACLKKCKAECCLVIPFPKEFFEKHKPVRGIIGKIQIGNTVLALTDGLKCPYLTENRECSVYDERPEVCRKFGDESHPLMTCPYQDKNGRIRSRRERRKINKEQYKFQNDFLNRS